MLRAAHQIEAPVRFSTFDQQTLRAIGAGNQYLARTRARDRSCPSCRHSTANAEDKNTYRKD